MSRHVTVRMVLTKKQEQLDEHTWLGSRVITHEFYVPLDGRGPTGIMFDHPISVESTSLEFDPPNIDRLIAEAKNTLLDELRCMDYDTLTDYLHPADHEISEENW